MPRGAGADLPPLAGLEGLDVPVSGDARLDLSNTGEILSGTIGIDAAPGQVLLPWLTATPLRIDGGHLEMSYSRAARRLRGRALGARVGRQPSAASPAASPHTSRARTGPAGPRHPSRRAAGSRARAAALQRLQIDDWSARGLRLARARPRRAQPVPGAGRRRGGIRSKATSTDMAGAMKARLDGKIGAMPASIFKTLWPAPWRRAAATG